MVRFPGGTDVDKMNWTDMIDNAPDRESPERPVSIGGHGDVVTNRFGFDEFSGCGTRLTLKSFWWEIYGRRFTKSAPFKMRPGTVPVRNPWNGSMTSKTAITLPPPILSPLLKSPGLMRQNPERVSSGRLACGNSEWDNTFQNFT
ncbi:MAG: hypothetical protein LAT79_00115 [Kiritimatiellae bacterium]|nr:hypothetical protein [Kiritimatiellia bacterium]